MVCETNLYTSYLIQIDTDSYRILGQKYRLSSQKYGRSDIAVAITAEPADGTVTYFLSKVQIEAVFDWLHRTK